MNDKLLCQLYFNCDLSTKEQVFDFISKKIFLNHSTQDKDTIIQEFYEREKLGSPLIAEHIILPHIESDLLENSNILFLKLEENIPYWDEGIEDIRLIIVILLKKNEKNEIKNKISSFSRLLADDEYLESILNEEDESILFEKLNKR